KDVCATRKPPPPSSGSNPPPASPDYIPSILRLRAAGRHGERLRADGPGALDIVLRVADDENLVAAQMVAEQQVAALSGDGGDVIAVFVIVRERARLENLPKLEVAEFDFRAQPDVAGQQTNRRRPGQRVELMNEFPDAGIHASARLRQQAIE